MHCLLRQTRRIKRLPQTVPALQVPLFQASLELDEIDFQPPFVAYSVRQFNGFYHHSLAARNLSTMCCLLREAVFADGVTKCFLRLDLIRRA